MSDIGLPTGWRYPGVRSRLTFNAGNSLSPGGARRILLVVCALAGAPWTANSFHQDVRKEEDVEAGMLAGSEGHRAFRALSSASKTAPVDILVVAPSSGAGATAAVSTFTLAGTAATTKGFATVKVAEETGIQVTFEIGETPTGLATNIRNKVAGMKHLPVNMSGTAGAVTFTAKQLGARMGTSTFEAVPISIEITGSGLTVSGGGYLGATTPGTDGAVTELAALQLALVAMATPKDYYVVYGNAHNATCLSAMTTWIGNSVLAQNNHRCCLVTGSREVKSVVTAVAIGANYERLLICHQARSYWTPEMLAGQLAATMQLYQDPDPTYGFVFHAKPDWKVPAAPEAYQPSPQDVSDLISDGVSTIESYGTGSRLVMLVDTRSKDSTGAYDDFRSTEFHRVSGADYIVDSVEPKLAVFIGQKLGTRPKNPDGTPDMNFAFKPGVFDEYVPRKTYIKHFRDNENLHLQRVDETIESLSIVRSGSNSGALVATWTNYIIDINTQINNDAFEGSNA